MTLGERILRRLAASDARYDELTATILVGLHRSFKQKYLCRRHVPLKKNNGWRFRAQRSDVGPIPNRWFLLPMCCSRSNFLSSSKNGSPKSVKTLIPLCSKAEASPPPYILRCSTPHHTALRFESSRCRSDSALPSSARRSSVSKEKRSRRAEGKVWAIYCDSATKEDASVLAPDGSSGVHAPPGEIVGVLLSQRVHSQHNC